MSGKDKFILSEKQFNLLIQLRNFFNNELVSPHDVINPFDNLCYGRDDIITIIDNIIDRGWYKRKDKPLLNHIRKIIVDEKI